MKPQKFFPSKCWNLAQLQNLNKDIAECWGTLFFKGILNEKVKYYLTAKIQLSGETFFQQKFLRLDISFPDI